MKTNIKSLSMLVAVPIVATITLLTSPGCAGSGSSGTQQPATSHFAQTSAPDNHLTVAILNQTTKSPVSGSFMVPAGAKSIIVHTDGADATLVDSTVVVSDSDTSGHEFNLTLHGGSATPTNGSTLAFGDGQKNGENATLAILPTDSPVTPATSDPASCASCSGNGFDTLIENPKPGTWTVKGTATTSAYVVRIAIVAGSGLTLTDAENSITTSTENNVGAPKPMGFHCNFIVRAVIGFCCAHAIGAVADAIIGLLADTGLGIIVDILGEAAIEAAAKEAKKYGCPWFTTWVCNKLG